MTLGITSIFILEIDMCHSPIKVIDRIAMKCYQSVALVFIE